MLNLLFGILIILTSSIIFVFTWKFFKTVSHKSILLKFIEVLIYYKVFFYLFVPAVLRTFSGFQYEIELGIKPIELLTIYLFEAISYFIWVAVFCTSLNKCRNIIVNKKLSILVEQLFVIILILFIYLTLMKGIKVFELGFEFNDLFESLLYILFPLVNTLGPVLSFFGLVYYKYDNPNNKKFLLSILATLFYIIVALISGVRGLIVHPLFFVVFMLFIYGKKRSIKLTFFLLFGFAIFQGTFMQIRSLDTDTKLEMLAEGDFAKEKRSIISEIEWRYGEASRMSVAFLRRGMNNNHAGIQPLLSSLYAPLPRVLFPDKPEPGSVGQDKYSMGFYLINSDLRGQWWNMTEYLTSAHAYWEFGILGILIITIITAIYMSIIAKRLLKLHILGIPIMLIFFKPWGYNEPKIWLYEIPLQIFQFIIPGLALLFVLRFISAFKKLIIQVLNSKRTI